MKDKGNAEGDALDIARGGSMKRKGSVSPSSPTTPTDKEKKAKKFKKSGKVSGRSGRLIHTARTCSVWNAVA